MPNVWFTADFHLGHKNIIRYCNRPFDTVEAMNCAILERLNSAVRANDVLYFLGDFCIGPKARALELRREIRCKKIFAVPGNHDKDTRKLTQEFSWLGDLALRDARLESFISRCLAFVWTLPRATAQPRCITFDGCRRGHP
jgi:calcineurin-like phosphoesterase family protein